MKFKLYDKRAALDTLARLLGLYRPERHEHVMPEGVTIRHVLEK